MNWAGAPCPALHPPDLPHVPVQATPGSRTRQRAASSPAVNCWLIRPRRSRRRATPSPRRSSDSSSGSVVRGPVEHRPSTAADPAGSRPRRPPPRPARLRGAGAAARGPTAVPPAGARPTGGASSAWVATIRTSRARARRSGARRACPAPRARRRPERVGRIPTPAACCRCRRRTGPRQQGGYPMARHDLVHQDSVRREEQRRGAKSVVSPPREAPRWGRPGPARRSATDDPGSCAPPPPRGGRQGSRAAGAVARVPSPRS
jgi:hypothetical protein